MIEGDDVERFLDETLDFVGRARVAVKRILDEQPESTLADLLARTDAELGPFSSMPNELAATVRGVLNEQGVEAR